MAGSTNPGTAPRSGRARPWWLVLGSAATLVLLAWGALQFVSLLARSERDVSAAEPATGLDEVAIEMANGSLVVRGTGGDEVQVTGTLISDVTEARFETERDGGRWVVRVRCSLGFLPTSCGSDLEVAVPEGLSLSVRASNSPVRLVGLSSAVDVQTSNDRIEGDDVSGPVVARTSNDRVELRGLRSSTVDVQSSNDLVRLDFADAPDTVRVRTSNDRVSVVVPDGSGPYAVDLSTSNGSANNQVRSDPSAERRIEVRTSNDDVTLRYPG